MDFSFMRTGQSLLSKNEISQEFMASVIAQIRVYVEHAIQLSSIYVIHCCREEITQEDILRSLQSIALQDKEFWDKKEIKDKALEYFKEELFENTEEDNNTIDDIYENLSDNFMYSEKDKIQNTVKQIFPHFKKKGFDANESAILSLKAAQKGISSNNTFTFSDCPCCICEGIKTSKDRWENWAPDTSEGQYIRSALEKTIQKFQ